MKQIEDIEKNFMLWYNEWKQYDTFFHSYIKDNSENMKEKVAEVISSEDTDQIYDFYLNIKAYPEMYSRDLSFLLNRVITCYNLIKESVNINEKICEELDSLKEKSKLPIRFVIKNGKAEPLDKNLIDNTIKYIKEGLKSQEIVDFIKKIRKQE